MQLKWYGQAAFRIVSDDGLRIVCDEVRDYDVGPMTGKHQGDAPANTSPPSGDDCDFSCESEIKHGFAPELIQCAWSLIFARRNRQ